MTKRERFGNLTKLSGTALAGERKWDGTSESIGKEILKTLLTSGARCAKIAKPILAAREARWGAKRKSEKI